MLQHTNRLCPISMRFVGPCAVWAPFEMVEWEAAGGAGAECGTGICTVLLCSLICRYRDMCCSVVFIEMSPTVMWTPDAEQTEHCRRWSERCLPRRRIRLQAISSAVWSFPPGALRSCERCQGQPGERAEGGLERRGADLAL